VTELWLPTAICTSVADAHAPKSTSESESDTRWACVLSVAVGHVSVGLLAALSDAALRNDSRVPMRP
jgi:hypothetical protein